MQICCTKKLLMGMKITEDNVQEEIPLFRFSAHLIMVNRRKTVVVVNDNSRFGFILHGLKAKDFKNLDKLILQGIERALREEKIKDQIIKKYLEAAGALTYARTKGPQFVSRLNKACELVNYFEDSFEPKEIYQRKVKKAINGDLIKISKGNDYEHPYNLLLEDLKKLYGEDIINCEALNITIKLNLEKNSAVRKIIAPMDINFQQLHEIIQMAFEWKNRHLHDFKIFDEAGKFIVNIVSDKEEFYEGCLTIQESETMLLEYISGKYKIIYCYDFGDNWEHEIIIESKESDYDKNYPVCIEGEGNTPPENVGGTPGYEEFLEIMEDVNHPEHKKTRAWLSQQWYSGYDLESINSRLRSALR